MDFVKIIEELLQETTVIGGTGSCMGSNVVNTASVVSKDSYAPGDARTPKSLYGGIVTRFGMKKKKKKKK